MVWVCALTLGLLCWENFQDLLLDDIVRYLDETRPMALANRPDIARSLEVAGLVVKITRLVPASGRAGIEPRRA